MLVGMAIDWRGRSDTDLLLVLLVNGIESILDGDTFQVSCGNFQTEREVQVNFLDRRLGQMQLENCWILDG